MSRFEKNVAAILLITAYSGMQSFMATGLPLLEVGTASGKAVSKAIDKVPGNEAIHEGPAKKVIEGIPANTAVKEVLIGNGVEIVEKVPNAKSALSAIGTDDEKYKSYIARIPVKQIEFPSEDDHVHADQAHGRRVDHAPKHYIEWPMKKTDVASAKMLDANGPNYEGRSKVVTVPIAPGKM